MLRMVRGKEVEILRAAYHVLFREVSDWIPLLSRRRGASVFPTSPDLKGPGDEDVRLDQTVSMLFTTTSFACNSFMYIFSLI